MAYDTMFGFDLIQRRTLLNLLADAGLTPEQTAAITAVASLPTTDPGVAGEVWNDAGTLTASQGP